MDRRHRTLAGIVAALPLVMGVGLLTGCESSNSGTKFQLQGRRVTVRTEPAGARVYQIPPFGGARVDLGMSPVVDQPVMVLSSFNGSYPDMTTPNRLFSELGVVVVRIEKDGYEPWEGRINATDPKVTAERTVTLQPLGAAPSPATARAGTASTGTP